MFTDRLQAAERLARLHKEAEPKLTKAFLLLSENEHQNDEPVKLLEIVEDAVEAGVMPIFFHPNKEHGVPFASIIVELSPREFQELNGADCIPEENWKIGQELSL